MGALNSILDVDTFLLSDTSAADVTQEDEQNNELTPTLIKHKRLLELDPRSPSEAISRTPIVIDKTPVSAKTVKSATPLRGTSSAVDPRSPTSDFLRTPIIPGHGK